MRIRDPVPVFLDLSGYYLFYAIRADLLRRLGRTTEAALAYEAAIARAENTAEQLLAAARITQGHYPRRPRRWPVPGWWPTGGPAPSAPSDDHVRLCGQAGRTGKYVQRPSCRWVVARLPVADEIPVHR
jgi:hypothetical protein